MHVPRPLAATAILAASLVVQACSDSEDGETTQTDSMAAAPVGNQSLPGPMPRPLPPAPAGIDACGLLSAEDVAAAIGMTVDQPEVGPSAGGGKGEGRMTRCTFASNTGPQNAAPAELLTELDSTWFVMVTVWVWPEEGEGAGNYIKAMRDAPMTGEPVRDFDDLADEAVWNGSLHARTGDTTISVDVRPAKEVEDPNEVSKERNLIEKALARL